MKLIIGLVSTILSFHALAQVPARLSCLTMTQPQSDQVDTVYLTSITGLSIGQSETVVSPNVRIQALKPFTSDGCSLSPDGLPGKANAWLECCVAHDQVYWIGGTEQQRVKADEAFGQCIAQKGHSQVSRIYETAVKRFGVPQTKSSFRWGYGWTYQRPYSELSAAELNQVQLVLAIPMFKSMFAQSQNNTEACTTEDPSLRPPSALDALVYNYLNKILTKTDRIEWAYQEKFNRDTVHYFIKISQCEAAYQLEIKKSKRIEILNSPRCEF